MSDAPLWDATPGPTPVTSSPLARMRAASRSQERCSRVCPQELRMDGRLALVTGGNAGIGLATCRGLLQRGARVVMLSRNASKAIFDFSAASIFRLSLLIFFRLARRSQPPSNQATDPKTGVRL